MLPAELEVGIKFFLETVKIAVELFLRGSEPECYKFSKAKPRKTTSPLPPVAKTPMVGPVDSLVWLAPAGYDCRVDTANGLWGFCTTTVFVATDCGLGGYYFDQSNCTSGCGVLSGKSSNHHLGMECTLPGLHEIPSRDT